MTFPARNRIIAGLATLTVVVEAAERSGSLITATLAEGQVGREVGAVPGRPTVTGTRGSNTLLRQGCAVIRDAQDVLDQLFGAGARVAGRPTGDLAALAPGLRQILHEVRAGRDTVGELFSGRRTCRRSRNGSASWSTWATCGAPCTGGTWWWRDTTPTCPRASPSA